MRKQMMLVLLASCALMGALSAADDLAKGFVAPPPSARPWVYWFPLSGNLTKEGITADLEAMARVGIGGVLYMEVDQGAPKGPADFAGPVWRELIQHACKEARRLGLEINMNNDAGWCGSGGPWITPELSMQKLTMSETRVEGSKPFDGVLPLPPSAAKYYRDITVLAFHTPDGDEANMRARSPKASASLSDSKLQPQKLVDGNPATALTFPRPDRSNPQWVAIEFPQSFTARTLTLHIGGGSRNSVHGVLQVSDDGMKFRKVREFDARPPMALVNFDLLSARWFRVQFTGADRKLTKLVVSEVELSERFRIENFQGKAAFERRDIPALASAMSSLPAGLTIPRERVVELGGRMNKDGRLTWNVPAGKWTLLRIGHTTTGKDNHPAPESGRGL